MSTKKYDLFVIGGGSGGVRAARIAAQHGAKVGLAESKDMGGTCVNVGCVPKKLFKYASDFSRDFEDAKGFGWSADNIRFDWKTLLANKDAEIKRLNGIYEGLLKNNNVDIFDGHAKFIDDNTIEVDGQKITADKFLIATGGVPFVPEIDGKEYMSISDDVFHMPDLPKRMVILGGGYIATEFASIFSGMGSQVTQIQRGPTLLKEFDSDISKTVVEDMKKHKNLDLQLNTNITKVEKKGNEFIVHTTNGDKITCDMVVAATGRAPNTKDLGLENTGVKLDKRGRVAINTNYETDVPHIYAVGDVCNDHNLTPVALEEGHALSDRLIGKLTGRKVDYNFIATAVFSTPPAATVGLTEEQARDQGIDIDVYKSNFRAMKHTISGRDEKTMMKIIVDKTTDRLLGFHMVGEDAAEIIQLAATVLRLKGTKKDLDETIGIHPTAAEEFVTMRTPVPPPKSP